MDAPLMLEGAGVRPSRRRWGLRADPAGADARPAGPSVAADLATALLLFAAWRGLLFGFDFIGRSFVTHPLEVVTWYDSPYWGRWARFDSGSYWSVLVNGYTTRPGMDNTAFFPLYPYASLGLAKLGLVGSHWAGGLLISNLSLALALFYMLRIARTAMGEEAARRSLAYLLCFPSSFFLSAFYTEGLFLLATTASFYHFLRGRYALCGALGFVAALTRVPGVMLLPAYLLGHAWSNGWRLTRRDLRLAWLGLIPCGLACFMLLLYWRVGDPFAFSAGHAAWGREYSLPHRAFVKALAKIDWSLPADPRNWIEILELASTPAFLALPLLLPRGFHKALPIYSLLLILLPLATGSLMSMLRLEVVAFPAFFALARLGERRGADRLIIFASALFLGLFKLAHANVYWIG